MRKKVIVTGATGHLGACVVRDLNSKGYDVSILVRKTSPLDAVKGTAVSLVFGDILDKKSLEEAFQNVDIIIHMAACVEIAKSKKLDEMMMKVNYEGTKNVVDVAIEKKIKRLIYVSTSHVCELAETNKDKKIFVEGNKFDLTKAFDGYSKSKLLATEYVLNKTKSNDLDAIVVYPSAVIGPFAWRISNTHQIFIDYIERKIPFAVTGSYSFVDVRDVSNAIVESIEKGRKGEGYLLTNETITITTLFKLLEEKTKIKAPKICLPLSFVIPFAPIAERWYRIRKKKPLFSKTALKTLATKSEFDNSKARKELGFSPRPISESICDSVDFVLENNQANMKKKRV